MDWLLKLSNLVSKLLRWSEVGYSEDSTNHLTATVAVINCLPASYQVLRSICKGRWQYPEDTWKLENPLKIVRAEK